VRGRKDVTLLGKTVEMAIVIARKNATLHFSGGIKAWPWC